MTLAGVIARLAVLRGALRARRGGDTGVADDTEIDPRERRVPRDPRAELIVAALLALAGLLAAAFAVLLFVHPQTQILGALLGGGLACGALGAAIASKAVVVQEVAVEPRRTSAPEHRAAVAAELRAGAEGITRRRVLVCAAGTACCGMAAAVVVPLTSLGSTLGDAPNRGPWQRGRRLVDAVSGRALRASDIEIGSFTSALPSTAEPERLTAPVVVVRVEPAAIHAPRGRASWSPQGLLAFSQICTHAGCAITLFRYPTSRPTSEGPALVCPCHYSTFDVTRAAQPTFGPAVRPLPQLPLTIAPDGTLVADGPLSGSVGPSWWSVKR